MLKIQRERCKTPIVSQAMTLSRKTPWLLLMEPPCRSFGRLHQDQRITISCETEKLRRFRQVRNRKQALFGGPGISRQQFWYKEFPYQLLVQAWSHARGFRPNWTCNDGQDRQMSLHEMQLQRFFGPKTTPHWIFQDLSGNSSFEDLVFWRYRLEVVCICHFFWNFTKLHFPEISENFRVGGFNPSEKYASQNGFIFPQIRDENKKYLSCHHPVRNHHPVSLMKNHHLGWPRAEVFFMIWSSHTEASRPFDFSSQRTGFHLWSQGWVCWLMNLSIYWFIDWFMYWFIDWLFETASSAASLWANVWLNHYLAHCKWNHDSGGASKQPNNQLEKVEVCAATFMYIYIYTHLIYLPLKRKDGSIVNPPKI